MMCWCHGRKLSSQVFRPFQRKFGFSEVWVTIRANHAPYVSGILISGFLVSCEDNPTVSSNKRGDPRSEILDLDVISFGC